jgi:polysaccharide export outer membrane protein
MTENYTKVKSNLMISMIRKFSKGLQLFVSIFLLVVSFHSCVPVSKSVFFPDIKEEEKFIDSSLFENSKRVYAGDRIQLRIVTKDEEANAILNAALQGPQGEMQNNNNMVAAEGTGYLIDPDGFIEIPTLGKIAVRGKTPTEIKELVKNIISDFYKDVEVYCTIGGRVIVINGSGGQIRGGSGAELLTNGVGIPIINERLTIIEVLSSINPTLIKIDKIWLIRETDGVRRFIKVNLNTKDIFDSPYFYLRNNDMLYLEPYNINNFIAINTPIRALIAFIITIPAIFIGIRTVFVK